MEGQQATPLTTPPTTLPPAPRRAAADRVSFLSAFAPPLPAALPGDPSEARALLPGLLDALCRLSLCGAVAAALLPHATMFVPQALGSGATYRLAASASALLGPGLRAAQLVQQLLERHASRDAQRRMAAPLAYLATAALQLMELVWSVILVGEGPAAQRSSSPCAPPWKCFAPRQVGQWRGGRLALTLCLAAWRR